MQPRKQWIVRIAVLALAALAAACGSAAAPGEAVELEGTQWLLASLEGSSPVEGSTITLGFFPEHYLEGDAGCNSYGANYYTRGNDFEIEQIRRTSLACRADDAVQKQEAAYLDALEKAAQYGVLDGRLEFRTAAGQVVLSFVADVPAPVDASLQDTAWLLSSLRGKDLVSGSRITLNLDAEGFQGSAGCNRYGGEYQAAAGGVFVPDNVWQTEKECPAPDLQEQEEAYLQALRSATAYRLDGDHLEIQDAAGETVLAFALKGAFSIDPALEGGEWVLTSLKDATPLEGTQILLAFSDGQAGGFAGCNSYGGAITAADEGVLAIGEIAMTAQGCLEPAGVLEQEEAYIEALTAAAAYGVGEDRLEIFDTEGHAILNFDRKAEFAMDPGDLLGTRWQLVSMAGVSPAEGSRITLIFQSGDRLSGEAGCRGYVASYQAAGDDIRFPEIGMTGPTGPCSDALLLQEGQYTTHLELATNYRLGEGALEFFTAQGKLLLYEPLPADADAALEGTPWTLADMIERRDVEGVGAPHSLPTGLWAGTEITAVFQDGQVRGSAGCNSYGGAYTLEGSELRLGSLEATEIWCAEPEGVMDQEQRYLGLLREANHYRIDGNQLWLETGDGRALIFDAATDSADCIRAGALPPEDAELVWPALLEAIPNPVAPGQAVEVRATGGYLTWETPCGTVVQESARSFAMAFDDGPVGSLDCYANTCLATLTIPSDLAPGEHTLSVEGGSNLIIMVGDG